jgi:hypothetical protein
VGIKGIRNSEKERKIKKDSERREKKDNMFTVLLVRLVVFLKSDVADTDFIEFK